MTRSAQGRRKNVDKKDTSALQHQDTNDWIMTMGDLKILTTLIIFIFIRCSTE